MGKINYQLTQVVEDILRTIYDDFQLLSIDTQGACSYTALLITTQAGLQAKRIIQAREAQFALDLENTAEAVRVYGHLAPATKLLATKILPTDTGQETFYFYELGLIPGVPYSELIPQRVNIADGLTLSQQRVLVGHLARFFARGWHGAPKTPVGCRGRVGSQISNKLDRLSRELPSARLGAVAEWALGEIGLLERLPVILTHGDLVPSNIMVHPDSGMLRGLVDWVEAEYLPFGLALYGLEYLLGFACSKNSDRRDSMTNTSTRFTYYDCAPALRAHFWATLLDKVPELKTDLETLKAVHLAKVIGTLLWFGFAWDRGAIDRVVSAERDAEVWAHLHAFIFAEVAAWNAINLRVPTE
jgi:hypothetical protein